MKKIYALLFLLLPLAVVAQRNINLKIRTVIGSTINNTQTITPNQKILYDGATKYFLGFIVANLGPDSLYPSDTFRIKSMLGGTYRGSLSHGLGVLDSVSLWPTSNPHVFNPPPNATFPYSVTLNWCDTVELTTSASVPIPDPDPSNNIFCEPILASAMWAVGIDDANVHSNAISIFPNPATGKLNIRIDGVTAATILLRNAMGQTVYKYIAEDSPGGLSHAIDISHLPAGIYTAELRHDDTSVISKVNIQ